MEAAALPRDAEPVRLTQALEDYLESIHLLLQQSAVARVRDIAKARGVRTGSAIPALRRLRDAGLIDYQQREYVSLTPRGQQAARRVYARHQILARFFREVLHMAPDLAEQDACAMEHGLSDEGMDRLVRLFEFLEACPKGDAGFLEAFHECSLSQDAPHPLGRCRGRCRSHDGRRRDAADAEAETLPRRTAGRRSISALRPGQGGTITHIEARGGIRQRLLDMGMLPHASLELVRVAPAGDPLWIRLEGTQLALRRNEAEAVFVQPA